MQNKPAAQNAVNLCVALSNTIGFLIIKACPHVQACGEFRGIDLPTEVQAFFVEKEVDAVSVSLKSCSCA